MMQPFKLPPCPDSPFSWAENTIQEIIKKQVAELNRQLEDIARNLSTPPIVGEITAGKVKWRGLRVCIQRVDLCKQVFWIEQRGKQIGPKIEL